MSAFLLFQVQPLIAKLILPWFGGSAAVWTSCMLFFQMALLGGYAYAHWLNGQPAKRQTRFHIGLLLISFISLPILPNALWKPDGPGDPLLRILGLLTATVGLPYFLLSSTSPLVQSWYSRSNGGAMPWRFFALSNAGSMAGLLAYPVLVEPYLTSGRQAWMWSISYAAFAVVCGTVAYRSRGAHTQQSSLSVEATRSVEAGPGPRLPERLLWMGLAACASALLLAVTNHLTQNVAAIPFLWVLPLSLYLLSFILCFDSDRWYDRWLFMTLGSVALGGIAYAVSRNSQISGLAPSIAIFSTAVFILFMVCHGELAHHRPAANHLTAFYLMVSIGGALGGLFIGVAAPYFFNALYDLPVVISITALLLAYLFWCEYRAGAADDFSDTEILYQPAIVIGCAGAALGYGTFGPQGAAIGFVAGAVSTLAIAFIRKSLARSASNDTTRLFAFAIAAGLAVGVTGFLAKDTWRAFSQARVLARNFYGALVVYDKSTEGSMGPVRVLQHGTIDHGEQFLWPQYGHVPTTYYARKSGIGLTIQTLQTDGPMTVGVIGLGAGTLAAYARPLDRYRFYDINPLVLDIAKTQFTYLRDCYAAHDVVLGDARLSLEREPVQKFDVLAVDAFSGDAIPVHLLTREAYKLYWRHLNPDGVLAVHVSNRYLVLGPVVAMGAAESGKTAKIVSFESEDRDSSEESDSDWVLVTSRPGFFDRPELKTATSIKPITGLRMWTDDYSNLYKILR
ncbi:MAG: fused MFS/spermidine synthase [Terriglobia bacterium]